jgi:Spy/CpxP family protein refolding chaperone
MLALLVLLLVALAGGLAGVALDRAVLLPRHVGPRSAMAGPMGRPMREGRPGHPRAERPDRERMFRERMARHLGLGEAQRARIDSVLDRQLREVRAVRAEAQPKLEEIRARARREMDAILTPEQRAKADSMARMRRGMGGP